eukprot:1294186-Ditylum_brightwellii.AAC.1
MRSQHTSFHHRDSNNTHDIVAQQQYSGTSQTNADATFDQHYTSVLLRNNNTTAEAQLTLLKAAKAGTPLLSSFASHGVARMVAAQQ